MKECRFCRIISGELPSSRVLEDDLVCAFLALHAINPGHTLVVPRRHVYAFTDFSSQEVVRLSLVANRIASALKASMPNCEGVSLSLADGEAAGQEVPHAHLHVIPRQAEDGFGWRRYGCVQNRSELDAIASRIRSTLESNNDAGKQNETV